MTTPLRNPPRAAWILLASLLATAHPAGPGPREALARATPRPAVTPTPTVTHVDARALLGEQPAATTETRVLTEDLAAVRRQIEALATGETPPGWASHQARTIEEALTRVRETQERLSARIETPLPRLDEPLILFTVAASTFILGFFLGARAQRRRSRRDTRLRI